METTKKNFTCPVLKQCGGCVYQGMDYDTQLTRKEQQVKKLLSKTGKIYHITGMDEPYYYRNKVNAAFSRLRDGTILSGMYEEGTHRVVSVKSCLLEDQLADRIIGTIRELAGSFKIKIYNENSRLGLLRHVMVRRGFSTGQVLVILVLADPVMPSKNNFLKALLKKHPEITSVVLNINDKKTSMVLGSRNIILYGKGYIEDVLCGMRFRISPSSFYQINPVQTEKMYAKAIDLAGLTGKETVLDAYCGIGTIALIAAGNARRVIGVELNQDAVMDARLNRKLNNVKNAEFYVGDAGGFMEKMAAKGEHLDVIFMDPPRTGSDKAFLTSMVNTKPDRIVYVSCNPKTQAKDLEYLCKHGYRTKGVYPFDLFPWTGHVETVCLLVRRNGLHVDIDVDVEKML